MKSRNEAKSRFNFHIRLFLYSQRDALRMLTNAGGNFESHPFLLPLTRDLVRMFSLSNVSPSIQGQIITFINVLAYNESCRYSHFESSYLFIYLFIYFELAASCGHSHIHF
jgi:hypothetical protein